VIDVAEPTLTEQQLGFLQNESERMLTLYTQALSNAQSVFNFYLSFVTAVLGAIIVILQLEPSDAANRPGVLIVVLFFGVIVGSVYLSALSGRYAQATRYARAVDVLRRHMIGRLNVPLPSLYSGFLNEDEVEQQEHIAWYYYLLPTGTYEMFIAIVNSSALSAMIWLIFAEADAGAARTLFATMAVFLISLTVFNAYSRLVINRFSSGLNIYTTNSATLWASARD